MITEPALPEELDPTVPTPVRSFLADLADQGVPARLQGPAVVYSVLAVDGALVGQMVQTAVSVNELAGWPAVPPHWIHFPSQVGFSHSNTDTADCLEGWLRHSRDIGSWSSDRPPVINWLAHVRGVIATASS